MSETIEKIASTLVAVTKENSRAMTLLAATLEILQQCDESPYVCDALQQLAHYDGTDCDGYCLMQDIADHLKSVDSGSVPEQQK